VIELDPSYAGIHRGLSLIYLKQGRNAEALNEAQKGVELSGRLGALLGNLGFVQAQTGNRSDALNLIKELEGLYERKSANGHHIAAVYAGLGDEDNAFAWLEKDFHNRTPTLAAWMSFTHFESVQDDPRMTDLRRRMGFPPSSRR
jgi:Flp pilus assembly protein TadD